MKTTKRVRAVRGLVAGICAAFVLQMAYIARVYEEPYPALMMPRFGWAGPGGTAAVEVMVPVLSFQYADGSGRQITLSELFQPEPDGHRQTILETLYPPSVNAGGARGSRLTALFPGLDWARRHRDDPARSASLRSWLARRACLTGCTSAPARFVVDWYREVHDTWLGHEGSVKRTMMLRYSEDLSREIR